MGEWLESEVEADAEAGAPDSMSAAVTLALDGARHDPHLREDIKAYFHRQQILMATQIEHLHEQFRQLRLKRLSEVMKLAAQSITVTIGVLFLGMTVVIVWQAANSRSLVIDAFSVAPHLAEEGYSGETLAREFKDRIAKYGEDSKSARAPASYENAWGKEVEVEIPETGLSFGQIEHFLRERFGHDSHISGEVIQGGDKLVITVRVGDEPADRAEGDTASLDALMDKVALGVYARTEPFRYAMWLVNAKRLEEARTVFLQLANSPSREDRIWSWVGLLNVVETFPEGEKDIGRALALDPSFGHLWFDQLPYDKFRGHDEAMLTHARTGLRYAPGEREKRVTALGSDWAQTEEKATIFHETADFQEEITVWRSMDGRPDYAGLIGEENSSVAIALTSLHDPEQAAATLGKTQTDKQLLERDSYVGTAHSLLSASLGNWQEAARQLEEAEAYLASTDSFGASTVPALLKPLHALALAHIGRAAEAESMAASLPADCYDCVIARARIADIKGDQNEANRWFAEAVRQGPSLPRAWQFWGESLLARGDLVGAEKKFESAAKLGPKWADPLKGMGDIALHQGKREKALRFYDQAIALAPAWKEAASARAAAASTQTAN